MERVPIHGSGGASEIWVGGRLDRLAERLPAGRRVVVVTDANVQRLYGHCLPPDLLQLVIGTGEGIKTLDTVADIYGALLDAGADRSAFLLGVGGGIVCDVTGFAASTYMRGVGFAFAATTLLAQVDASVGGKNGVNFRGFKNMVGTFNQPAFVICDPAVLSTLPEVEVQCGLAEVVKHALIADRALLSFLEDNAERAVALEPDVVRRLVGDSVRIKSAVVNRDERESGERRKLNFGHTFGHAVEKVAGVPHGHAVSVGMVVAAEISAARGRIGRQEVDRIRALLERLGLPLRTDADREAVLAALGRDKKRQGDRIHFVLLDAPGRAVVEEIALEELQSAAAGVC
jgi:3-dehydroquinate synthase